MSGVSSVSRLGGSPVARLIDAAARELAGARPEERASVETASRSRWQQPRNGTADRGGRDGEADAAPAAEDAEADVARPRRPGTDALVRGLAIDPSKGYAAARFEAVASRQARRAYEASQRVSDDRGASSGNLFDAPS